MARESILPNPSLKLFEAYMDFSGGLNSETGNEMLKDNEFPILDNVDLIHRGSALRRTGRSLVARATGIGQGLFYYHRAGQSGPDIVAAIGGQIYYIPNGAPKVQNWNASSEYMWNSFANNTWSSLPALDIPVNVPIYDAGNPVWTATTAYIAGQFVMNGTNIYQCTQAGTSASSGGPTGTGAGIVDGTATWKYCWAYNNLTFQTASPVQGVQYKNVLYVATGSKLCQFGYDPSPVWRASVAYTVGQTVNLNNHIYKCTVAGTSGTTGPTGTNLTATVTDGGVTWQYMWDVWYAAAVAPYQPTAMEAIYIGLNAIAPNPNNYITDESGLVFQVVGIQPSQPFGLVNQAINLTCLIEKPSGITSVKYAWSYRESVSAGSAPNSWTAGPTANDSAGKVYAFTPTDSVQYDIQVVITDNTSGAPTPLATNTYVLSGLQVYATSSSAPNDNIDYAAIQTCRCIALHWDRILMWGDNTTPWQMYISDLMAPQYFPVDNTILFDIGRQEPITSTLEFRGNLIVFTTTSTQILTGKSPNDYQREILHNTMGCISEKGAGVTGANITFLSAEGVQQFRPNPYMIDVMDLSRVDYQIKSELVKDPSARALVYDSQFWICIPSENYIYRYYYEQGNVWARDVSSKLHFVDMIQYGDTVHNLSSDGNIYVLDSTVYTDGGEAYNMTVESKYFDLGAGFNWKRTKRVFFIARQFSQNVNLQVTVTLDSAIALEPAIVGAQVITNPDGSTSVTWSTAVAEPPTEQIPPIAPDPSSGWFQFLGGTVPTTQWTLGEQPVGYPDLSVIYTRVRGKARRVRVQFVHSDPVQCEVFGFGIEFKEKKPY